MGERLPELLLRRRRHGRRRWNARARARGGRGAGAAATLRFPKTRTPKASTNSSTAASTQNFYDAAYAVTHVVYTLNDYDKYRLRPSWLPREFAFLKKHLARLIEERDPETVGEFLECLKCFGLSTRGPLVSAGTDFLLASQNADGSWGRTDNENIYRNYHTTLAATGGLTDVRWRGPRLAFPEMKPLLLRLAKEGEGR